MLLVMYFWMRKGKKGFFFFSGHMTNWESFLNGLSSIVKISQSDAQLSSYRACFRRNGLIRVETHRVNEEIFLNRHSQGKNSQTITQVKTRLPREKTIHSLFLLLFSSFFKSLPLLGVIISWLPLVCIMWFPFGEGRVVAYDRFIIL